MIYSLKLFPKITVFFSNPKIFEDSLRILRNVKIQFLKLTLLLYKTEPTFLSSINPSLS